MSERSYARGKHVNIEYDMPEQIWGIDGQTTGEAHPAVDVSAGLVSLAYVKAALKRQRRFWCVTAAIGLLVGCGLYVKFPPGYTATTSVFLTAGPNQDPAVEIANDAVLAQSNAVTEDVIKELKLPLNPASLASTYTVTVLTPDVLLFTVKASSAAQVKARASALTLDFLKVRARTAEIQLGQTEAELNQQVTKAQQTVDLLSKQVTEETGSASTQDLKALQGKLSDASNALQTVRQYATNASATAQTATKAQIQFSRVLDAAAVEARSRFKKPALYVAGGLVAGLAVGIIIVVIGAMVSDRLRRRDDIAEALGAPVRLSVGRLRKRRFSIGGSGGVIAARKRASDYLANAVPGVPNDAGLAIVAVDNVPEVADLVVEAAKTCASRGNRVVLADISGSARAARRLGVTGPGVRAVSDGQAQLVVARPGEEEVTPSGPRLADGRRGLRVNGHGDLFAACQQADVVLAFVELDPGVGGEHLVTWAREVVVVVTTGQSSAVRLRAVGDMIRLAGIQRMSVVLVDADEEDETLGSGDWGDLASLDALTTGIKGAKRPE